MIAPSRRDADAPEPPPTDGGTVEPGVVRATTAEFLAALTVLTRLPVAAGSGERAGSSAFVVVGALVGVAGLAPLVVLGAAVPPIAAILAIGLIAIVSGAVHLDGLADTADALTANGPDGAERARKDPAVGVGGVVALLVVLGIEAASLALLATDASPLAAGVACVVASGVSRGVPVVLVRLVRHPVRHFGLGEWFAARTSNGAAILVTASAAILCLSGTLLVGAPTVLVAGGIGGIGGLALGMGLSRLRQQVDGDLLGASVELSFALTLVTAAAVIVRTGG